MDNIRRLLAGLGNPEKSFPAVLIGGTNGKGSTGAFLANGLKAAGLKVGWTTSPHLLSPTERIWIDGVHCSEADLDSILTRVLAVESAAEIKATYFELMVASAILAFGEASVDIALVEVGMGGRWDSTNVLSPILTILTSVALDHTGHLGETIEAIAREKLCTARDDRPLVLGPGLDPDWVRALCESKPEIIASPRPSAEIFWDYSIVNGYRIGMAGDHQVENLATAMATVECLRQMGWRLNHEATWRGFSGAAWPGRLWRAPALPHVIFDGAHNASGAEALAIHIKRFGIRAHLFFGAMGDKDLEGMARVLATTNPLSVTLVNVEGPRYSEPEALQDAWQMAGYVDLPILTLGELATKLRGNVADTVIVTGSLYFLGHLMRKLNIPVV
ncbi:MAG: Mur ligase family protein [Holophagaceae bacterium]|nr:Mur ligase family protein [Holophagaceae bacterium]